MRKIPGYTWETLLDESYMRTQVTIEMMNKEVEREENQMKKTKRK